MATLLDLRTVVAGKMGDPFFARSEESGVYPKVIDFAINEAQYFVQEQTFCLSSKFSTILKVDQHEYNLANVGDTGKRKAYKIINVLAKDGSGNWKQLKPKDEYELDRDSSGWRTAVSSTPTYAGVFGDSLNIHPASDTEVVKGLWIFIYRRPDDLVDSTDSTLILSEYQRYITQYAYNLLTNREMENEKLKILLRKERVRNLLRMTRDIKISVDVLSEFKY